jgi:beta-lactamase regulating signal transducer with metallopeptidase domain
MNAANEWMITLAWSLLHFLWQGALIAAMAAGLMYAFRKPAMRYLIGMGALAAMFLSFAVTFAVLDSTAITPVESMTSEATTRAPAAALLPLEESSVGSPMPWTGRQAATNSPDRILWLAQGWMAGVFVLALRLAFGLLVIEYLRRRNLIALPDALVARFERVQLRLGLHRFIRYRECTLVHAPAVIGFLRPIVLIPMRALTGLSPEQLEAVIAHELGHIKRFDVLVNLVQVVAETLFFFHPAVWWLNRRIRADREHCCDDIAVGVAGERLSYARALAAMASWRDAPRLAMAVTGGPLAARVARLLGVRESPSGGRAAGAVTLTLLLASVIAASGISLGMSRPALAQTSEAVETSASPPIPAPVSPPSPVSPASPVSQPNSRVAQAAEQAPAARPAPAARSAPSARPAAAAKPAPAAEPSRPQTSYIEELRRLDVDFDVDQLVALKVHGVTPEYISAMRRTGLTIDTDDLIAMKVHQVDPQFVAQVRAQGFQPDAEELVAFSVHGISAEYVKEMRAAGFEPDARQLIAMKVHNVTPDLRRAFEASGYEVGVEELISARAMGVTPEFIEKARAHGFKNLSFEQLIRLKAADVL